MKFISYLKLSKIYLKRTIDFFKDKRKEFLIRFIYQRVKEMYTLVIITYYYYLRKEIKLHTLFRKIKNIMYLQ